MRRLNIAIIGGGVDSEIGATHINAINLTKKFNVVAGIFSLSHQLNLQSAKKYSIKNYYSNIDQLFINHKNIDGIVLLTPFIGRLKLLKKIIQKQIPVISEKPFLSSISEGNTINKISKKNFITVTYNYTGYPMVREIKYLLENNFFGNIKKIFLEMPSGPYLEKKTKVKKWRLKDHIIPNTLLDLGSHALSIIYFLTKQFPTKFISKKSSHGKYKNLIDDLMVFGELEKKINFNIWVSKSALGYDNGLSIRIFGSKASCKWLQTDPENLEISTNDKKKFIINRGSFLTKISKKKRYNNFKSGHPSGFLEAFSNLYDDIFDAITKYKKNKKIDEKYLFNLSTSLKILKKLEMF